MAVTHRTEGRESAPEAPETTVQPNFWYNAMKTIAGVFLGGSVLGAITMGIIMLPAPPLMKGGVALWLLAMVGCAVYLDRS
jgi:uncharacterized membrane protein YccC